MEDTVDDHQQQLLSDTNSLLRQQSKRQHYLVVKHVRSAAYFAAGIRTVAINVCSTVICI